jgi:signal transduction histidine kinase
LQDDHGRRLAAGATDEISNPLTAILGYSELLADIPALSPGDRDNAKAIHQRVHHAQAAVNSLRDTLRRTSPLPPITADKSSAT